MDIKEMHYDFKKKLNKIDSQQYRNLVVPEIDWTLNEAQELFIKMVAFPRLRSYLGFEKIQRNTDDIRTLVKNENDDSNCFDITDNIVSLPDDYWHYLSAFVLMSKNSCQNVQGSVFIREHDDEFMKSPFDKSSFEWRTVNAVFFENGVRFYTNNEFLVTSFCLSYLRRPVYIHNAEDFGSGNYNLPSGTNLTGTQNCELPEHTHREIVDIAVLIAQGELENPTSYQLKQAKLNLNNLGS